MKISEVVENYNLDFDTYDKLSYEDHWDNAFYASDQELHDIIDMIVKSKKNPHWADVYYQEDTQRYIDKQKTKNKKQRKTIQIDPSTVFYRGLTSITSHGAKSRDGYATFVTTSIEQAASYAGENGIIVKMHLNPNIAYLYEPKYGDHVSFTEIDEQSLRLNQGEALVVKNIMDSGGYKSQMNVNMKPAEMNVSFTDESIADIIGTEPASSFFK